MEKSEPLKKEFEPKFVVGNPELWLSERAKELMGKGYTMDERSSSTDVASSKYEKISQFDATLKMAKEFAGATTRQMKTALIVAGAIVVIFGAIVVLLQLFVGLFLLIMGVVLIAVGSGAKLSASISEISLHMHGFVYPFELKHGDGTAQYLSSELRVDVEVSSEAPKEVMADFNSLCSQIKSLQR